MIRRCLKTERRRDIIPALYDRKKSRLISALHLQKIFITKALNKEATEELTAYLEPDEKSDNTTYQTVNIHSDITHIQWGDMKPSVIGDVEWDIKESNTVYTSILAKYKVSCTDEEGAESIYNVKEFFRVRFLVDTIYLLDYNRNMEQVFDGRESDFDENGIILGIIPKDISYEINKDQTSAAFVQAGELWLYESKKRKSDKSIFHARSGRQRYAGRE